MTSRNRSARTRSDEAASQRPSSAGQWLLGTLVVLALIASLLMIFGNDFSITATLAVIAALWAAVIGAVLVTKYRKQADVADARSKDLRLVYELQLEREIAARRQYESDVESAIRHEVAAESNVELEELKMQVLALRASLEHLLGKPLPDVRAAIGLDRPRELGSGLRGADYAQAVHDDRVVADRDFATTAPPVDSGRHVPEEPQDVEEVDPTQLTEIIPVVTDDPADYAAQALQGLADTEADDVEPVAEHEDEPTHEYVEPPRDPDTGAFERAAYGAQAYEPPPVPPQTGPIPVQEEAEPAERARRGTAPSDDGAHSAGLPASELLSQLRAAAGNGGGRSRRRRD
ncbi:DUF6779 domain-containing protein [Gordonia phthalatica]|uniref:DUF6779 domain-containing protein n=1 Tax=Gordonia phthalatica TaxID=1136941 RepID=A0A0N7FV28_9ACTN|nr:DUF6779 domain-containing protein [Gordonia phthalatica]ALG85999.1 hypothetical protein ACH46_17745 [Gordonia phthalatica]